MYNVMLCYVVLWCVLLCDVFDVFVNVGGFVDVVLFDVLFDDL